VIWVIPCLIILVLGVITWDSTHTLDPYRRIAAGDRKPINVEVVSLDWKWLFIYPDLHIASVNEMAMPVGTPVSFNITSDTVMNSFFIPQLGSQIYAMAGMQTRLHLLADHPGTYRELQCDRNRSGGLRRLGAEGTPIRVDAGRGRDGKTRTGEPGRAGPLLWLGPGRSIWGSCVVIHG
jgi:cytochrome o ubiquinol oxidase subunit 2